MAQHQKFGDAQVASTNPPRAIRVGAAALIAVILTACGGNTTPTAQRTSTEAPASSTVTSIVGETGAVVDDKGITIGTWRKTAAGMEIEPVDGSGQIIVGSIWNDMCVAGAVALVMGVGSGAIGVLAATGGTLTVASVVLSTQQLAALAGLLSAGAAIEDWIADNVC